MTTDEINTCSAYDLASKIIVTATITNEEPKIITPVWQLYSGYGTLSGTVYTSIAKSETAVFSATYTENGISKLALFRLKVNGLSLLSLNKSTSEIQIPGVFDLGSELSVTAKYYNGKTQEIGVNDGLIWTVNGSGILNGTLYTPPSKVETAIFTASYTSCGITQKASFRLAVVGLSTLSFNKITDEIHLSETYDLSKITVTAKLSNGQTSAIVPSWNLSSGSGIFNNSVYTPAKPEVAIFTASYAEPDTNLTKTAQFRLIVTGLNSITLNRLTDEIKLPETYDLSSISVIAKLSNGQAKSVIPAWTVTSGSGSINGAVYIPTNKVETALLTASYAEPNTSFTKTAQFRLIVTGLNSIVLSQLTDEIQLPLTYDLGSELIVKANYSNNTTQEVTHSPNLSWVLTSGSGTLNGTVYTPAPKIETAIFTANYMEAGIVKTAKFSLKVIGLSSLSLNKTTDEVQSCDTYNLVNNLVITDKLSNGIVKDVTSDPNVMWTLVSGKGSFDGTVYRAPAIAETAVFSANYNEAGIAKIIYFRLRVNALVSLSLNKITDEIQISTNYNLTDNLKVTAKFSNGQTKEVTLDPNTKWTLSFGSGNLQSSLYTSPERIETAIITVTYVVNGIAQSAQFRLKVSATVPGTKIQLVALTLNKTTDDVQINQTYDLKKLIATARYSDKTTKEVSLSWIIITGGGTILNNFFIAPNNVATIKLMGSYMAEDNSSKSVFFTIKVVNYYDVIESVSNQISSNGGYLKLNNGIMLYIPQNSIMGTAEIVFQSIKYRNYNIPNDLFFNVKTNVAINNSYILIPPEYAKADLDSTYAEIIDLNSGEKQIISTGVIENLNNAPLMSQIKQLHAPLPVIIVGAKLIAVGAITAAVVATPSRIYHWATVPYRSNIVPNFQLNCPYYEQSPISAGWCGITSLLMTLKTYKKDLDILEAQTTNIGNSLYRLAYLFGITINEGITNSSSDMLKLTSMLNGCIRSSIPFKKDFYFECPAQFANYILESIIDKKTPLIMNWRIPKDSSGHSVMIIGYTIPPGANNYDQLKFIVHDPSLGPYITLSYQEICKSIWCPTSYSEGYANWSTYILTEGTRMISIINPNKALPITASGNVDKSQVVLQTIQMNYKTIKFVGKKDNFVIYDKNFDTGYNFEEQEGGVIPTFDKIIINGVPIYDTDMSSTIIPKVCVNIIEKNSLTTIFKDDNVPIENVSGLSYKKYVIKNYSIDWKNIKISDEIKLKNNEFILKVALCDQATSKMRPDGLLDSFDIKFKCIFPKFLFSPQKKSMNIDENFQIDLKYGLNEQTGVNVGKYIEWNLDSGTIENGLFKPNGPGTYKITATLKKGTKLDSGEIIPEDIVISFYIDVYGIFIKPVKSKIYFNETCQFELKYGTNEAEAVNIYDKALWDAGSGLISISGNNAIYTPKDIGIFLVKASYENATATAEIEVVSNLKIYPEAPILNAGDSINFVAKANENTVVVSWTAENGTINENGTYMAPEVSGKYLITAKSEQNGIATAEVIVKPVLKVNPASQTMKVGETLAFTALMDNKTVSEIQWSSTDGCISTTGEYKPKKYGNYIITVRFQNQDIALETTASVTVNPGKLEILPDNVMLNLNQSFNFKAKLDDETIENGLQWQVVGLGTITQAGVYTAPNKWGTNTIKVVYQEFNLEDSVPVIINDERIQLLWHIPFQDFSITPLSADGTIFPPKDTRIGSVLVLNGTISTLEVSIEGNRKIKIEYIGTNPSNANCYMYKIYSPQASQLLYDTNEIYHVTVTCPENRKAILRRDIILYMPVMQSLETNVDSYKNSLTYQAIKYGDPSKSRVYNHGIYKTSILTVPERIITSGEYYCGEKIGTWLYYNYGGTLEQKEEYSSVNQFVRTTYFSSGSPYVQRLRRDNISAQWKGY